MPFIIRRTDQGGGYVQPAGSPAAYGPKRTARRRARKRKGIAAPKTK